MARAGDVLGLPTHSRAHLELLPVLPAPSGLSAPYNVPVFSPLYLFFFTACAKALRGRMAHVFREQQGATVVAAMWERRVERRGGP